MIYFDNAATGGFKPSTVIGAAYNVSKFLCANPGRSGHRLSVAGSKIVFDCRKVIADFFGGIPERVVFTKNCTEALNTAIFGCVKKGGHVITTTFDHNSVLRPLFYLEKKGDITLSVARPSENKTLEEDLLDKIRPDTFLIVMSAVSNVTGEVLPFEKIARVAKEKNIAFILDGAQAGGHIPLSLLNTGISAICVPAHKGLYSIMGCGALILSENFTPSPLIFGGTGIESQNKNQPEVLPERLESGTLPLPAIAALFEGVRYAENNMRHFGNVLYNYTEYAIKELTGKSGIKVYSAPNKAGIVSFAAEKIPSQEFADILNVDYDIAVRGGLHCSPLTHEYLNSDDSGLVRISFAPQNSVREINLCLSAIEEILSRR